MLQPNRRKFRKEHKGRNTGVATRGATVAFGDFGFQCGHILGAQFRGFRHRFLLAPIRCQTGGKRRSCSVAALQQPTGTLRERELPERRGSRRAPYLA